MPPHTYLGCKTEVFKKEIISEKRTDDSNLQDAWRLVFQLSATLISLKRWNYSSEGKGVSLSQML